VLVYDGLVLEVCVPSKFVSGNLDAWFMVPSPVGPISKEYGEDGRGEELAQR